MPDNHGELAGPRGIPRVLYKVEAGTLSGSRPFEKCYVADHQQQNHTCERSVRHGNILVHVTLDNVSNIVLVGMALIFVGGVTVNIYRRS